MAVTDQPSGLMDIASTLTQDEIPFKLRCAICNKLAVNAFRLPCCEQAICESCQALLPDTCPVCAHTPLSSDLCKPNKALRTTLKAFLRTEEKKREKDRQSATPAAPADGTSTPPEQPVADAAPDAPVPAAPDHQNATEEKPEIAPSVKAAPEEPPVAESGPIEAEGTALDMNTEVPAETQPQNVQEDDATGTFEKPDVADQNGPGEGDETADGTPAQSVEQENTPANGMQPMPPNAMGFNMPPGGFPMGWNGSDLNPMAQFMPNGMFNPPNPMGMSGMAMDPMAASQGMLGGYGMNLNGMNSGMNMGMNFDAGQGMYGGWDGSQNNMWNGGQDKFNPNAFANGMGSQYGPSSGFGGYNNYAQMQHQPFPNQDFSNDYYGPGYGRGNFRGRGRGFVPGGRGRGGFPGSTMHANYPNAHNPAFQNPNSPSFTQEMPSQGQDGEMASAEPSGTEEKNLENGQGTGDEQDHTTREEPADGTMGDQPSEKVSADTPATEGFSGADNPQLQGIPTIDSFDQANAMSAGFVGMPGQMGPGFGRGYMRGPFPGGRGAGFPGPPFGPGPNMPGPGVEGAPAAPRAMRQGLPNTSVLRHRQLQAQGRGSVSASRPSEVSQSATPVEPQEGRPRSRSRSRSRPRSPSRSRNRSRSPTRHQSDSRRRHRYRSPGAHNSADEYERRRERQKRSRREEKYEESAAEEGYRTRSPSRESSRRSRRHERERDRRSGRRSRRSHRHRSRTRSPSRSGDARDAEQLSAIPEENGSSTRDKDKASEALEPLSRSHRSGKNRSSRREERERDREARRRDRDRDRDRRDRDRDRGRYRERDRERDRERHRDRERDRDSKRSRRDRTASPVDSDYSTRHRTRRTKRSREEGNHHRDNISSSKATTDEPEKDPHTLEREARNRERLLKEQQRREAMHPDTNHSHSHSHRDRDRDRDRDGHHRSSRRQDSRSRQDRLTGGRKLGYKYEDDEERAARVEEEREADRWA